MEISSDGSNYSNNSSQKNSTKEIKTFSKEELIKQLKNSIKDFLFEHNIYESIPENAKVLLFTDNLTVKDAIKTMILQNIYSSIIIKNDNKKILNVFSLSDILNLIYSGYLNINNFISFQGINNYEALLNNLSTFFDFFKLNINTKAFNKTYQLNNLKEFFDLFEYISLKDYLVNYNQVIYEYSTLDIEYNILDIVKNKNNINKVIEDKKNKIIAGIITYNIIFDFLLNNYYILIDGFKLDFSELYKFNKYEYVLNKNDSIIKSIKIFVKTKTNLIIVLDDNKNIFGYLFNKDILYLYSQGSRYSIEDTLEKFFIDFYNDIGFEIPYGNFRIKEISLNVTIKEAFENIRNSPEKILVIKNEKEVGIINLEYIFDLILE